MSTSRRALQLCVLLVGPCLGSSTILVYNSNNNDHNTTTVPTTFADQPAGTGFGPKVPDEVGGIQAALHPLPPSTLRAGHNACRRVAVVIFQTTYTWYEQAAFLLLLVPVCTSMRV